MNLILSPSFTCPSTTLKKHKVPRYWSYALSKTSALKGLSDVSSGGGTYSTTAPVLTFEGSMDGVSWFNIANNNTTYTPTASTVNSYAI